MLADPSMFSVPLRCAVPPLWLQVRVKSQLVQSLAMGYAALALPNRPSQHWLW
jgi:hypothetical protein